MSVALVSLAEMARHHRQHPGSDPYRSALGFITDLDEANATDIAAAIACEPELSGDGRVDALLAALAEHVAFHHDIACPAWCESSVRFLRTAWFPVDLPSVRVRGLVTSPASFARRGVFIDRSDLDRV